MILQCICTVILFFNLDKFYEQRSEPGIERSINAIYVYKNLSAVYIICCLVEQFVSPCSFGNIQIMLKKVIKILFFSCFLKCMLHINF